MKFADMSYQRPEVQALVERYRAMTRQIAVCREADKALSLLDEHEELQAQYRTMESLAYIRHSVDTTDPFYEQEMAFFDESGPVFSLAQKDFKRALSQCPVREALQAVTGPLLFTGIEIELKTSSEAVIPLCQRENELCTTYEKLLASARIPFDGEERNLAQMQAFQVSPDRETRRTAWESTAAFFERNAVELDDLFDELVHNRTEQARLLGYSSYVQLGYDRLGRNCYGPKEVRAFRDQIVRSAVPAAARVKRAQADRLGIERTMYYDNGNAFMDGNPRPQGGQEEILAAARRMYRQMGPLTGDFFDFMEQGGLFDLTSRPGKQTGGYCTSLPAFKSPFIFANFNGTSADVDVLTHEGGHALAYYLARDMRFAETMEPPMETCETHSMSMELFCARFAQSFFGEDTQKFLRYQLESILGFLPYGCMVDEFQEIMYECPQLSAAQRKETWARLEQKYRPWLCFEGVPFFEGGGYQRQHHIYSAPLYYIDYCLAQTAALAFWSASLEDWNLAFDKYLQFTRSAGTKTFTQLLQEAGLPSPFIAGGVDAVCGMVERRLGEAGEL